MKVWEATKWKPGALSRGDFFDPFEKNRQGGGETSPGPSGNRARRFAAPNVKKQAGRGRAKVGEALPETGRVVGDR